MNNVYLKNITPMNNIIVSISPGGYKGFYILGIASYIRDHYNIDNCIFSGASAGAWVSLLMTYKGNYKLLLDKMGVFTEDFKKQDIPSMENYMKHMLLLNCQKDDFHLSRLFIGVVQMDKWKFKTNIYSEFHSLEDAIDCCISSSHIPFITGKMTHVYNNKYTFDGGFSKCPYLHNSHIHIHPSIWPNNATNTNTNTNTNKQSLLSNIIPVNRYTTLFTKDKYVFEDLYWKGYNHAKNNKDKLDQIFVQI
jgi:hypothetical protein